MNDTEKLEDIENRLNNIKAKMDDLNSKIQNLEKIAKILQKMKPEPFVIEIISKTKKDEKFFTEFVNFIKRNGIKREVILAILKRNILNGCKNLKFV